MQVKILGSGAGGGFPQWNCACANCSALRAGRFRGSARTQTQIAVRAAADPNSPWVLINASPDLRGQILADLDFSPRKSPRDSPIEAVVLTGSEVDQVMGLLHLREFQPLQIFCTPSVEKAIREGNSLFRVINRENQTQWKRFDLGRAWEFPEPERGASQFLKFEAMRLDGDRDVVGLSIEGGASRIFCAPSLAALDEQLVKELNEYDVALMDGTFWSDDELIQVRGIGKKAREMGHLPISGPDGTMSRLAKVTKPRKIFIHVNNTNPILSEESAEYRELRAQGWEVAFDGMEIELK